jgi:hypothetical protein
MLDMRSKSRRVARFMIRPALVRMNRAKGTKIKNSSVSCQLIQQAPSTQANARNGSATTFPNSVRVPVPSISMSLVKRAINSCVPSSLKLLTSRWMTFR